MASRQLAELTEPGIRSLDDSAAFETAQLAAIFLAPLFAVPPIGRDQLNAAFIQTFPQRVRIIDSVGHPRLRILLGTAFGIRDADCGASAFRKTTFSLTFTLRPNHQPKTLTNHLYQSTHALAALAFSSRDVPFLAGALPPSMKHAPKFSSFCRHFTAEVQQQPASR